MLRRVYVYLLSASAYFHHSLGGMHLKCGRANATCIAKCDFAGKRISCIALHSTALLHSILWILLSVIYCDLPYLSTYDAL